MSPRTFTPQTESDVAEIVRGAEAPFEIVAHGTKRAYGRPVDADTVLDVSALSGIVAYEPEELVLAARAATPIAEIETVLAAMNQMLAFEPVEWGPLFGGPAASTLGGIVAVNACGPRRASAGAVRDSMIGCRFVNGRGEVVKAGGRVIKNVTGFDIPKLMAGAFGTLGVLTEIVLRVVPKPPRVAALAIACDAEEGLRLLREAAKSPVDASAFAYCPAPVMRRLDVGRDGTAFIRVAGSAEAVADKIGLLQSLFAGRETATLDDGATRALFRGVGNGAFADDDSDLWRLCVPPSRAYEAIAAAQAAEWCADWAGGLLWIALPADETTAERLRGVAVHLGGHATLVRASEAARRRIGVFQPETQARATLTKSVKAAFDPKRLINPGRMFEGV
jgi:glycolate oxidase FAD binding subunit